MDKAEISIKKQEKSINLIIGTENKGKIEGAKLAFEKYFSNVNIISIKVPSDINEQPFNDEILEGARNRINHLKELNKEDKYKIDFYISSEAGIIKFGDKYLNINLAVICDKEGKESIGTSQGYMIPESKIEEIKIKSLGKILDELYNAEGLSKYKGGINYLTQGVISRVDLVENSFILALVPFLKNNECLWK